jgi:hypothetical protein
MPLALIIKLPPTLHGPLIPFILIFCIVAKPVGSLAPIPMLHVNHGVEFFSQL